MTEIRTTLKGFKDIVDDTKLPVFESAGLVATILHGVVIKATKNSKTKIFDSWPLESIGYSGIASNDYSEAGLESMLEEMESLDEDGLKKIKKEAERLLK